MTDIIKKNVKTKYLYIFLLALIGIVLVMTSQPKTKNKEEDFYTVTKKLVTILEHEVIRDPDMWFWAHDRWKDGRRRFGGKKK